MNESVIFNAALKLPKELRPEFLDAACAHNPQLRTDVEGLLNEHDGAGSFMDRPAARPPATVLFRPITEGPGTLIGPYKLLQQIGEGGFGVVYMAEQQQPVRRKVAFKVLKAGMDTRQVIARFEAERQALALMDHPNIARVLDAGETASCRPYFVMELVKGIPITQFCDENQLTPRQRLELFLPVCQAIQHAHQKGIIHRDIKPSNILVAEYDHQPVPKVIDFGVAKATGQELTEKTMFTALGQIVGTLEYMSPEQAKMNQLDIDTRSDIYSLGVLLYELLTGTTPFDKQRLRSAAMDEILRIIREEEPARPSTRLSKARSAERGARNQAVAPNSALRAPRWNELDWIVMKALEKDRNHRYETVNSLGQDIQRYLHDEPVTACPPSLGYRLSKFTRRYKAPLAIAGGFVLLLLAGVAVSSWQAVRAKTAEAIALTNERRAVEAAEAARIAKNAEADQRRQAESSEQIAIRERNSTLAAQEALRETLYAAEMNLVQTAVEDKYFGRAAQSLDEQPAELRGFEWHYWRRKLQQGWLRSVEAPAMATAYRWNDTTRFSRGATRLAALVSYPNESASSHGPRLLAMVDGVSGRELIAPFDPFADRQSLGDRKQRQLSMSADGMRLAVALVNHFSGADERFGLISIREGEKGSELRRLEIPALVYRAELSPDGGQIAVEQGSPDDNRTGVGQTEITIWNTATGELVSTLPKLPWTAHWGGNLWGTFGDIHWSPDGSRLVRQSVLREMVEEREHYRELFQVVDVASGDKIWERELSTDHVPHSVWSWSPDGSLLAVLEVTDDVASRHDVQLWDSSSGATVAIIENTEISVVNSSISFSPNGQLLAASCRTEICVWELPQRPFATASLPLRLAAPRRSFFSTKYPLALEFCDDGRQLSSLNTGPSIIIWDTTDREETIVGPDSLPRQYFAAISPDASQIAFNLGGASPAAIVWDLARNLEVFRSKIPVFSYNRPAFSASGRRVAFTSSAADQTTAQVAIYDLHSGAPVNTIQVENPDSPFTIGATVLSPDGEQIAVLLMLSSASRNLRPARLMAWDVATSRQLFSLAVTSNNTDAPDYSADGASLLMVTNEQREEAVWFDAKKGDRLRSKALPASGRGYRINERCQLAYSWDRSESNFILWDLESAQERLRVPGSGRSNLIAISPDGSRLALGIDHFTTGQTEFTLWSVKTGRRLWASNRQGLVNQMAFSADGNRLVATFFRRSAAVGTVFQPIQIWDATPLPH